MEKVFVMGVVNLEPMNQHSINILNVSINQIAKNKIMNWKNMRFRDTIFFMINILHIKRQMKKQSKCLNNKSLNIEIFYLRVLEFK